MKTLRKIWEKLGQELGEKLGRLVDRLVEVLGGGSLSQEPALVPIPVRDRPSRS